MKKVIFSFVVVAAIAISAVVVTSCGNAQAQGGSSAKVERWEYKFLEIYSSPQEFGESVKTGKAYDLESFNRLGSEGWELVSIDNVSSRYGRLQEEYHYITINNQSRLNGKLIYDTNSTCDFPHNVDLNETLYAEIFADNDTVDYGSFVEYRVRWLCSEEHWVGGIKNNSTFFIDRNFNQSGHSTFASKNVDVENKNKFYPSNKQSDTLRIIFGFSRVENGNIIDDLDIYLEKVFTVVER